MLAGHQGRVTGAAASPASARSSAASAVHQCAASGGSARKPVCTARARLLPRQCEITCPALTGQAARGCAGAAGCLCSACATPRICCTIVQTMLTRASRAVPRCAQVCGCSSATSAESLRAIRRVRTRRQRRRASPSSPSAAGTCPPGSLDACTSRCSRSALPCCPDQDRLGPYQGVEDTKPAVGACLWLREPRYPRAGGTASQRRIA